MSRKHPLDLAPSCWRLQRVYLVPSGVAASLPKVACIMDIHEQERTAATSFPETKEVVQEEGLEENQEGNSFWLKRYSDLMTNHYDSSEVMTSHDNS